ncbi:MAG: DnaJ domain-containing protein [Spirulinaceae cyanobacterium SM2_1_0]|nr:DnaJ domain-containing protein [Spirulinaceae cyanobacterium SM2_1_0]
MSFKIQQGLFKLDLTDYHAILGVSLAADPNAIRKRYLKIAHGLHPDTCKAKSESDRRLASEILSKLVNPAYEHLKGKSLHEYQLVLGQMGKRLAREGETPAVTGEAAKELLQTSASTVDSAYIKALRALTATQYKSIGNVTDTIGQISELNQVYLLRKEGEGIGKSATSSRPATRKPVATGGSSPAPAAAEPEPPSLLDPYVRRAQEYITKNNFSKAVLELRDGLKIDPNDSTCHALMGLTYFKQSQLSMAKVHISKALQADPKNVMAQKVEQALNRATGGKSATSSRATAAASNKNKASDKSDKSNGGMFGGLFGSSKKK